MATEMVMERTVVMFVDNSGDAMGDEMTMAMTIEMAEDDNGDACGSRGRRSFSGVFVYGS